MPAVDADESPDISLEEFGRWWKQTGFSELRQILYWRWDPIGVTDGFPWSCDEYDSYAPQVVGLARQGASDEEIADYLLSVERDSITLVTTAEHRLGVARRVLDWYPASIERWQAGLPNS